MVTVTSAQPSAPQSVFGLSQCSSGSDGLITIGCLAKGFSPADSLNFKWKDPAGNELSDFVQYPAFGTDGDYTKISHMRVRKSDWDTKKPYTCEASNSAGAPKTASLAPPAPPPDLRATVFLTAPTKMELESGSATFMCLAKRFSPKQYKFKWYQNDKEVTNAIDNFFKDEKNGSVTEYSATSILKINAEVWKQPERKVKCVFEHNQRNDSREIQYKDTMQDCIDDNVHIDIIPPTPEDMLKNRKGILKCKASGNPKFHFTKIEITANNLVIAEKEGTLKNQEELDAPINYKEWSNGTVFKCTAENTGKTLPEEKTFARENGKTRPSVYVFAPPEKKNEMMTLTCFVKNFSPKEVFVTWLVDDEPAIGYQNSTSVPVKNDDSFSMYSQITVENPEWRGGKVYTCVVYHESIDEKLLVLTRSITDNMDKSSIINLSMTTPAPCKNVSIVLLGHAIVLLSFSTAWIVWIEHPLFEPIDADDSGIANTAVTFIFLFLITLFYSIVIRVTKPSMALLSREDGDRIVLECQLNDYYPKELSVQWLRDGQPVRATIRMLQNREVEKTFTYISQLNISSSYDYKNYTCNATHNSEVYQQEYNRCTAKPLIKPSIQIKTTPLRDIIETGNVTLSCVVKAPDSTVVSWSVDGQSEPPTTQDKDLSNNTVSYLTVRTKDWLNKTIVCTAQHPCFSNESAEIQADDVKKDPEVEIRRSFMKSAAESVAVLECVVSDLPPGEVCITFQANNVNISDLECVDSAPSNNSWSLIRPFKIPDAHQKTENIFTCKVQRPFKQWTSKPTGHIFDDASSELVVGPRVVQSSSEYQKLQCSATGFYPEIQWLPLSSVKACNSTVTLMQDGHVKVYSEILVPQDEWNKGVNYTCRTTDGPSRNTVEKNTSICSVIAPFSQQADVYLLGPPLNFASTDLNLTCIVIGQNVKYFIIQWKVNGNTSDGDDQTPVQHPNGTQSKVNKLKVSVNTWNSHALFTCEVKHLCSVDTQQQSILKTRDPKQPTVRILRPSDSDLSGAKNTSLVCFISDFFPSDILVEWKLNGKQLSRSQFTNSPVVAHSSGGFSMHSALILPGEQQKDGIYSCEVSHESSQSPIIATLENLYASLLHSAPSAELLQGADGLLCLVSGFSPPSINITWFMGMTEMSDQNKTKLAKDPDGKFITQSHLPLKPSEWAPGEVYTCRVTHVTGTQWFNISKNSVISEEAIFMNENKPEFIPQDTVGEVWNMACAFLILFLLSLVYGCTVTLVKVKTE
ncbi:uncharacterized protein ighd [Danio aesculapii]|uniref:uncharacterized protein ighd n=1 Tax=Danio aesculapii TaxID=1142201 RepID=UPI0024C017BB|nr:uncharacterized protein ighd [Danio aesculapii]